MDKTSTRARRILVQAASLLRKAWVSTVLIVLAGLMIASGFYIKSQPKWIVRPTIRAYNQGVAAYRSPPGLLPASEERPPEWPIQRAAEYFKEAASEGTDKKLRSWALYNLGTVSAREAYASTLAFGLVGTPRVEMSEAILWLAEAIRLNPANEDAKYNLEVLDKVRALEGEDQGAPGPGYSPGAVDRGF